MSTGIASISQRVESATRLTDAVRSATPPFPRSAKIELVARCDFDCFFCASSKHPRAAADMSQESFQRIALRLRRLGVAELGLFYLGESFLCDWLPDAVRYAKEVCGYPYVFLTTNGYTATPKRVRECMESGLDSLKFAFNWCGPDQFEAVTRRPQEHYLTVLANLRAARTARDEVEQANGHRCALYASSLVYDARQPGRMAGALAGIEPLVDEHYWLPLLGHRGLPGEGGCTAAVPVKALPCSPLFTEAHVTADGRLSACPLDASPRFQVGDLEHDTLTLTHAWRSPAFQALREAHLKGDVRGTVCSKCIAYGASE